LVDDFKYLRFLDTLHKRSKTKLMNDQCQ
jgi:hypothetical protein